MYDEMVAQAISALTLEQLDKAEEAIRARRNQLIQRQLLEIPLYANIRFRTKREPIGGLSKSRRLETEGGLIHDAGIRSGIVMRHLRRSLMVDIGDSRLRKVDFDDIIWPEVLRKGDSLPAGPESGGRVVGGRQGASILAASRNDREADASETESPV